MEYLVGNKSKAEQTATPDKYPQGYFKKKPCKYCHTEFTPKAPSELYCSDICKDVGFQDRYLERNYGITTEDYSRMYAEQGGLCAVCGGGGFTMTASHKLKLVVDHDHSTGVVRGLLCHNCNRALGLLHDDIKVLASCISYLEGATTIPKGSTPK